MELVVFGCAVVVVLLVMVLGAYFSPQARALRAMQGAAVVTIARAPEGATVRLVGKVVALGPALVAPISHRPCVGFRVLVQEHYRRKRRSRWRDLLDHRDAVDFALEDGTGRAIVRALGGQLLIDLDHTSHSGSGTDATPAIEAFLAQHHVASTGILGFEKSLRYQEGVLEAGETIAVVGRARWEDDPEPGATDPSRGGFRDAPRKKRLILEPGPAGPVYASDLGEAAV